MEYLRPLTEAEQTLHIDRLRRASRGEDFGVQPDDSGEQLIIFKELLERERTLVAPNGSRHDYSDGTAKTADEIYTETWGSTVFVSSEHATAHWTINPDTGNKTPKLFEPGTAALGSMVAAAVLGVHSTLIGKQTGNANYEPHHPYKQHIRHLIETGTVNAFFSVHGMRLGLVSDLEDERAYDLLIGVGNHPNSGTLLTAHTLMQIAGELNLRAAINTPFLRIMRDESGRYVQKVYSDGTPATNVFAAPEYTTRAAAQRAFDALGHNAPALQLELASNLRIQPKERMKDITPNLVGPYLGWEIIRRTLLKVDGNSTIYKK